MNYFLALNIFHSVAETESFTTTAKQLGVAVSSVTRQIDSLEKELGLPLFNRSTRQISLTNAGTLYLEQTRTILDDLESANQSLKGELNQPQGKLRITFAQDYGNKILAPVLVDFAQQYPKIQLEIYGSDEYIDLHAEKFDVAVRLGKVDDPSLIAKKLSSQKRLLCASPSYLEKYGSPKEVTDLTQHNCLLYSYRGSVQKWFFSQANQAAKSINIKGTLRGNSTEALLAYALAGIGIAHLPDWLISEQLARGELVSLLSEWDIKPSATTEDDAIYLLYTPNSRHIAKISVFIDFLMNTLGRAR